MYEESGTYTSSRSPTIRVLDFCLLNGVLLGGTVPGAGAALTGSSGGLPHATNGLAGAAGSLGGGGRFGPATTGISICRPSEISSMIGPEYRRSPHQVRAPPSDRVV